MSQQRRQGARRDAFDASSLPERFGSNGGKLLLRLPAKAPNAGVVQAWINFQAFVPPEGGDVGSLSVKITRIEGVDLDLCPRVI